ncbi:MAG: T9SS type A sorting domain-containing protein [Lentimicrobium sp.]|nr:T9SS type A sorting domain-containing protein [Lentimicrobium sp.]
MKLTLVVFFMLITGLKMANSQTTIQFSGLTWVVKSGNGGPGPNLWSDKQESVWVDSDGILHLKIRKEGNNWLCSEIYTQESYGYGNYKFLVSSNIEDLDPNIVAGLFTYETDAREIDIEFSRWGNPQSNAGWYTIQPKPYNSSNQYGFALHLNGNYSTHQFNWASDSILFRSHHGHYPELPPADSLIAEWTYKGNKNPPVGNERLHLNFWLKGGSPPQNQQEAELKIKAVIIPGGHMQTESLIKNPALTINPNPANDKLRIHSSNQNEEFDVSMYNADGLFVSRKSSCFSDIEFDVSDFPPGIYLVNIYFKDYYTSRKIIISH